MRRGISVRKKAMTSGLASQRGFLRTAAVGTRAKVHDSCVQRAFLKSDGLRAARSAKVRLEHSDHGIEGGLSRARRQAFFFAPVGLVGRCDAFRAPAELSWMRPRDDHPYSSFEEGDPWASLLVLAHGQPRLDAFFLCDQHEMLARQGTVCFFHAMLYTTVLVKEQLNVPVEGFVTAACGR